VTYETGGRPQAAWPAPPGFTDAVSADGRAGASAVGDLRFAALFAGTLIVLGALLGLLWSVWSPAGPAATVFPGGKFEPDETEAFIAGDGRYLVIVAATGVLAGGLAWLGARNRGPAILLALGLGGLAGASLTELVGHLTGGGSFTGKSYRFSDGSVHEVTLRMPLSLHTQGLLLVEAAVAALVYGLFVAFAARDDLGRPDPVRDALTARPGHPGGLVDPGDHSEDGGGHGDAPGALQQGNLSAQ
jgi:hypothetical protein